MFKIDFDEAERPRTEYISLEDLFTRELKPGMRTYKGEIASPCDGFLSQSGQLQVGQAIQAKGLDYQVTDLIYGCDPHAKTDWHSFATIYLAPHNYHRVHIPAEATLEVVRYVPGELWPVNKLFVKYMPELFVRNERVVFECSLPQNQGKFALVMVGAMNVGRIRVEPTALTTNLRSGILRPGIKQVVLKDALNMKQGDQLGTFMLGSTVVMVFDEMFMRNYKFCSDISAKTIWLGNQLMEKIK
jgi:phosphatidylserine decarboxylase